MLYKSVWRYFMHQRFMLVLLTLVIAMSAFIYGVMAHSVGAIRRPTEAYFISHLQEDFHLVLNPSLTVQERQEHSLPFTVRSLEALYRQDVSVFHTVQDQRLQALTLGDDELAFRHTKDVTVTVNTERHTWRLMMPLENVNRTKIIEGRLPQTPDEVMLLPRYAASLGLTLGDTVSFNGETVTVVGTFMVPDYSLVLIGDAFVINPSTRTLVMTHPDYFHSVTAPIQTSLGVRSNDHTVTDYADHPLVLAAVSTRNTLRSGAIYEELAGGEAMGLLMSLIIAIIGVFVVQMMVSKMLKDQRGPIGILKALGLESQALFKPYGLAVFVLALPGLLLGYALGFWVAPQLKELYLLFYVLPEEPIAFEPLIFMTSIVVPLIVLSGLSALIIWRLVREEALSLLQPDGKVFSPKPRKRPKSYRATTFEVGVSLSLLKRQKRPVMLFVLGTFSAFYLIVLGLAMGRSYDRMNEAYFASQDYNYMATCPILSGCQSIPPDAEGAIFIPEVVYQDTVIGVLGLDADTVTHRLVQGSEDLRPRLTQDGVLITQALARAFNLREGDTIEIQAGNLHVVETIVGIHDDFTTLRMVIERSRLADALTDGLALHYTNVIYTQSYPEGEFTHVLSMDDLYTQTLYMASIARTMTAWLTAVSLIMGGVVMLLILMMIFEQQRSAMNVMTVLGYDAGQLKRIFVIPYYVLLGVVLLAMIPLTWLTFEAIMWYLATQFNMIFLLELSMVDIVWTILLAALSIVIVHRLSKRKWERLSLSEAMKQLNP